MSLPEPRNRPPDCSCCWIMGFGLHGDPNYWDEEIFTVDKECPDHGKQADADRGYRLTDSPRMSVHLESKPKPRC